jgi:hypothetical protein
MSTEEDLHMALCVVKILALVVIASSLLSISGAMSGSNMGFASDPNLSVQTSLLGRAYDVRAQANNVGSSAYQGPGYGGETSQAPFSNRYEAPVFWNAGDIASYESAQQSAAAAGPVVNAYDAPAPAPAASGAFRGYAADGLGVYIPSNRGYATAPNGGLTASGQPLSPY